MKKRLKRVRVRNESELLTADEAYARFCAWADRTGRGPVPTREEFQGSLSSLVGEPVQGADGVLRYRALALARGRAAR